MKTPEEINKEGYPYKNIQTDERGLHNTECKSCHYYF